MHNLGLTGTIKNLIKRISASLYIETFLMGIILGFAMLLSFLFNPLQSQAATYTVTYTYDSTFPNGLGKLASVSDTSGTTNFYYDQMGRVTETDKTVDGVIYQTKSSFDLGGRVKSITYPDATTVYYHYNGPIQDQVYNATASLLQYSSFNSLGQPAAGTYGNGVVAQYTYSNSNSSCKAQNFRICTVSIQQPASAGGLSIQNAQYSYDQGGNITSISDSVNGNQTFGYDYPNGLNRLTSASGPYGSLTYIYDALGNITCNGELSSCSSTSGPNYQYDDPKHLHAVTYAAGITYAYDANGNIAERGGSTLRYDGENRLVSVSTSSINSTVNMVYDGGGGRVKKIFNGTQTVYIGKLYECTTITSTICVKYIFLGNNRVALQTTSGTQVATNYYHSDHLGSVFAVTDSYGHTTETIHYFPFGRILSGSDIGSMSVEQKYTGQQFDAETSLDYYGARYYDPALGRFISADAVVPNYFDPQSLNRYSYVRNNPIMRIDPSGHADFWAQLGWDFSNTLGRWSNWLRNDGLGWVGYVIDPYLAVTIAYPKETFTVAAVVALCYLGDCSGPQMVGVGSSTAFLQTPQGQKSVDFITTQMCGKNSGKNRESCNAIVEAAYYILLTHTFTSGYNYEAGTNQPSASPSDDMTVNPKDIIHFSSSYKGKVSEYVDYIEGTLTPTRDFNGLFDGYQLNVDLSHFGAGNPYGFAFWSESSLPYINGYSIITGLDPNESILLGSFSASRWISSFMHVPFASGYVKLFVIPLGADIGGGTMNVCIFACQ